MAFSTYAELQTAIASLLNRDDLTAYIPDFIKLFEAEFDANPDTAHHRRRICRSSATIDSEYETLAANYLSIQSADLETDPTTWLSYIDPDSLTRMKQDAEAWQSLQAIDFGSDPGPPKFYTIVGTEIRFFPAPETSYTLNLTVYERLYDLATYDTNWLLQFFPNIYLYGSAVHAAPFLKEDDRLATWRGLYDGYVKALQYSDPTPTNKLPLRTELSVLVGYRGRAI